MVLKGLSLRFEKLVHERWSSSGVDRVVKHEGTLGGKLDPAFVSRGKVEPSRTVLSRLHTVQFSIYFS
jgi:hypothetical protein